MTSPTGIPEATTFLRHAIQEFHAAHKRAGAREGLASERIFAELLAAHPDPEATRTHKPAPTASFAGITQDSVGTPKELWSFDDRSIGMLRRTGRSLESRVVPRPPGLSTHDWYNHASALVNVLNKSTPEPRSEARSRLARALYDLDTRTFGPPCTFDEAFPADQAEYYQRADVVLAAIQASPTARSLT